MPLAKLSSSWPLMEPASSASNPLPDNSEAEEILCDIRLTSYCAPLVPYFPLLKQSVPFHHTKSWSREREDLVAISEEAGPGAVSTPATTIRIRRAAASHYLRVGSGSDITQFLSSADTKYCPRQWPRTKMWKLSQCLKRMN
nr:uncharacterized protein LOC128690026 [Cherax quadricarinatus]